MNRNKIIGGERIIACHAQAPDFSKPKNIMNAMVLKKIKTALEWTELADPQPGPTRFA
jgi:hypothetical protein